MSVSLAPGTGARLDHDGRSDAGSGSLVCDPSWNRYATAIPIPLPRVSGGRYESELSAPATTRHGTVLIPVTSTVMSPHPALVREGATDSDLNHSTRVLAYRLRLAVGTE